MPRRKKIPFFTDQNVADSAGKVLIERGHDLTRLRDCMASDTKDPLVALACADGGHVLVSHDTDFREISKKLNITQNNYRRKLHRIELRCLEPLAAKRLSEAMDLIEREWNVAHERDHPMVIQLKKDSITVYR